MIIQLTEFVLPNGRRKYHEHDFPETENLKKVIENRCSFEFEQLTTGDWSLEIVKYDEGGDPEVSEMKIVGWSPTTIAEHFEQMVEKLGPKL